MPKMSVSAEQIKAPEPVPDNIYELRLEGFKPKFSSKKTNVNLNPQLKIATGQFAGKTPLFENLNSDAGWVINDFCHAFGIPMVKNASGGFDIPGEFVGPDAEPEKWQYRGPLLGKVGKASVVITTYEGKPQNKVKSWICAVPNCNTQFPDIRHSNDLLKRSSK